MTWRTTSRNCALDDCGAAFQPKRDGQQFCCESHGTRARVARHRSMGQTAPERSRYIEPTLCPVLEKPLQAPQPPLTVSAPAPTQYFNLRGTQLPIINGRINGIFDTVAELEAYQRALSEPPPALTYDADGHVELPAFLDRRAKPDVLRHREPEIEIMLNLPEQEAA